MICLACLENSLVVRYERSGRIYLECGSCRAIMNGVGVRGAVAANFVSELLEQIGVERVRAIIEDYLDEIRHGLVRPAFDLPAAEPASVDQEREGS